MLCYSLDYLKDPWVVQSSGTDADELDQRFVIDTLGCKRLCVGTNLCNLFSVKKLSLIASYEWPGKVNRDWQAQVCSLPRWSNLIACL